MKRNLGILLLAALAAVVAACTGRKAKLPSFDPEALYLIEFGDGAEPLRGFARFAPVSEEGDVTGRLYEDTGSAVAYPVIFTLGTGDDGSLLMNLGEGEVRNFTFSKYESPGFTPFADVPQYTVGGYDFNVINDVIYGVAEGFWTSYPETGETFARIYERKLGDLYRDGLQSQTLGMDIYVPEDGGRVSRPLLVMIHGGAFYNGDKSYEPIARWCTHFASMGYTVASINYRLGFWPGAISVARAGYRAVQDANAAIRYLVSQKDAYGIDPDRIFVAGTSAGGITALNTAFMTDDLRPEAAGEQSGFGRKLVQDIVNIFRSVNVADMDDLGPIAAINPELADPFTVKGIGNLWGAVENPDLLATDGNVSVISFHSRKDPVVPFGYDAPFEGSFSFLDLNEAIFPKMYGSGEVHRILQAQGNRVELHSYDIPRHSLMMNDDETVNEEIHSEIQAAMTSFFAPDAAYHPASLTQNGKDPQVFSIDVANADDVTWKVEGGAILEQGLGRIADGIPGAAADDDLDGIRVLMFGDADTLAVTVSGLYRNSGSFLKSVNL